ESIMSKQKTVETIGREPNSAVVFHALPRHDSPADPKDLSREPTKEEHWQDKEHLVHPPTLNDPKGIVGHLQNDWEKEHPKNSAREHEHGGTEESHESPHTESH
ncbi:14279_t:CDS:2, partial [Ambispora leptoticha]